MDVVTRSWDDRAAILASLVPRGSSVLELGAGKGNLEKMLPEGCSYTPSDIHEVHGPRLLIDLNAEQLPEFPEHDVAVLGGVLEYVEEIGRAHV